MEFTVTATTDVGRIKNVNQDCMSVMELNTCQGKMAFAVLCDGMGGLSQGEVASASVVRAFRNWVCKDLPVLCKAPIEDAVLRKQWERIVFEQDALLNQYADRRNIKGGTTVVAILLTQNRYYIVNVGDSRVYEINDSIRQLTRDHTLAEQEIEKGRLTKEKARTHKFSNVLTQSVGTPDPMQPDIFFGVPKPGTVFMLCSDGFRNQLTEDEMYKAMNPGRLRDRMGMKRTSEQLIQLVKDRRERDNISVALIRTY
jgi:serine/threonine protein phosphatase PrpC